MKTINKIWKKIKEDQENQKKKQTMFASRSKALDEIEAFFEQNKKGMTDLEQAGFRGAFKTIKKINKDYKNFIKEARKKIDKNPQHPLITFGSNVPFHLEPYSPKSAQFANVDIEDGTISILNRFVDGFNLSKKHSVEKDWLSSFGAYIYCLDGRLESMEKWLQRRIEPIKNLNDTVLMLLDAYAKDFGKENWLPAITQWQHMEEHIKKLPKWKRDKCMSIEEISSFVLKEYHDCLYKQGNKTKKMDKETINEYLESVLCLEHCKKPTNKTKDEVLKEEIGAAQTNKQMGDLSLMSLLNKIDTDHKEKKQIAPKKTKTKKTPKNK